MQVSVKGFTKKPVDLLTFVNDPAIGKSTDGGHVKICEATRFCASFIEACSNIEFADSPCERDLWKGSAQRRPCGEAERDVSLSGWACRC